MAEEKWADIKGYEGWYQVSTFGNVKRIKKVHYNHGIKNIIEREYLLAPSTDKNGYKVVILSNEGADKKHIKVHRLVADAFISNPNNYPQVDHIDRNRTNNNVENLRWVTNSDNQRNAKSNTKITAFGETKLLCEWAEQYKIAHTTILARLQRGWNIEDAISIPTLKEGEYLHGRRSKAE